MKGEPIKFTAQINACEVKVEMEINVKGRRSYYDIHGDTDIPLYGLSYKGATGLVLHVQLHKLHNELILKVTYFLDRRGKKYQKSNLTGVHFFSIVKLESCSFLKNALLY